MSTKTLRKRIALATVAALGAGVLSLVSTSVANAAGYGSTGAGNINAFSGIGLLTAAPDAGTTTTQTATLLSTGSLTITAGGADLGYYVVSAGAKITAKSGAGSIGNDQTTFTASGTDNTFTVTPTGAAGTTFTVSGYASSSSSTLVNLLTVTIAGASTYGVVSPAKSYLSWVAANNSAAATSDASGANATTAGNALILQIRLKDAYGNDITSTSGALVVTASSGAVVGGIKASGSAANDGTYSTAVSALSPARLYTQIAEATTGAGWSGTVTVTYNGTVIGTKSGTITGYISKIVLSNNKVSATSGDTTDAIRYNAYDTAGNSVTVTASQIIKNDSSKSSVVSNLVGATDEVITSGSQAAGKITVTAGSAGSADVSVKYVRPDGAVVVSNTLTHKVGGNAYKYTVALDKASYSPGDIAVLTVQFQDSLGNAANSTGAVTTITAGTPNTTDSLLATPQLTLVGAYKVSAAETPDSNGQAVYKYVVGSTDGTYAASVKFPTLSNGSAQTVGYAVKSGGTSLNDVLKGIVSLIASINKQIAALAKLVTKKK